MSEFTHGGTANGYKNRGCRCPECTEAWRVEGARARANRRARLNADPTLAPHGRVSTYLNWGCRCADCRAAKRRTP